MTTCAACPFPSLKLVTQTLSPHSFSSRTTSEKWSVTPVIVLGIWFAHLHLFRTPRKPQLSSTVTGSPKVAESVKQASFLVTLLCATLVKTLLVFTSLSITLYFLHWQKRCTCVVHLHHCISPTLPGRHVTKVSSQDLHNLTSQMFEKKWNHLRTLTTDTLVHPQFAPPQV